MHGRFPCNLDEKFVDKECCQWLKFGDIKGETGSTIVADQDQALSTNCFKQRILKEEIKSKCQLCKEYEETIDHLTLECPILAEDDYIKRHDGVHTSALLIMQEIRHQNSKNWCCHIPKAVCEH